MRTGFCSILLIALTMNFFPLPGLCSDVSEIVLQGTWGSESEQVGIKYPSPGVLPDAPFMGPGGFRVDPQGAVWISDSVNRSVKVFHEGKVEVFPIAAEKLGDLDLYGGAFYVCTKNPDGVFIGNQADGAELRRIAIPFKSPGRLNIIDENHFLVGENGGTGNQTPSGGSPDGGVWVVKEGVPSRHPAEVMEPVGNAERIFGIVYDLEESSRKIVYSGWTLDESEPILFSILRQPGQRIVYNRILGLQEGQPWVLILNAATPSDYRAILLGLDGKVVKDIPLSLLTGCYLPAYWIPGTWPALYGMLSDPQGFTVLRRSLE